jgi:hypothetical protein
VERARRLAGVVALVGSTLLLVGLVPAAQASAASPKSTSKSTSKGTTPTFSPPPTASAPGPGNISWSIQPSSQNGHPGKAAFVYYNVAPGSVIHDYVGVTNYSTKPVTFAVFAADAINTATGGYDALAQTQKSIGIGSWVNLTQTAVTVSPDAEANVPFTITVPAAATPGDHDGAILAQLASVKTTTKGERFIVNRRVGSRIYLRVVGPLHPHLAIDHLTAGYNGSINPVGRGSVKVSYMVRNTGNVALAGSQRLTVGSLFGTLVTGTARSIVNLIPGQSLAVQTVLKGVLPVGPLHAHVTLAPTAPAGPTSLGIPPLPSAVPVVHASVGLWALPWTALLIIVVVVAGLVFWRKRRKRKGTKLDAAVAAALEQGRREAEEALAAAGTNPAGDAGSLSPLSTASPPDSQPPEPG